jgi:hypothetical protein
LVIRFYYLWIAVFCALNCAAQNDTLPNKITLIGAQASIDIPMADLATRFGYFDKIGFSFHQKNKANWLFGARAHFIFGTQIKEPGLLNNVGTTAGGTITTQGGVSVLRLFQRGYQVGLDVGKILPIAKANANSGIMVLGSVGFMQHKINIFDRDLLYPQLAGEYKKGYDRLTNGIYLDAIVGYAFFSKKKNINLFGGFSFNAAKTEGRREWWFDVQTNGRDKRLDASMGIMLGWWIPIYQKKVEEVYY